MVLPPYFSPATFLLQGFYRRPYMIDILDIIIVRSNPCLSAINAENQQIIKQTPNFTPKNVKLGVFILFKTNHIRSENNLIKNRTNEKNNQFIFRKISYLCSK